MAFVEKLQEGNKTPLLYSFYDLEYDYNDLRRRADSGVASYIKNLPRGNRDYELYYNAYNNLMNGILTGRVVFKDGVYQDSQGEYTNYDGRNRNKDYYGLMASYIYNLQNQSTPYSKPVDLTKLSYNLDSLQRLIEKELIRGGNSFIQLDEADEKGVRSTGNRVSRTLEFLNLLKDNYNSYYNNYDENDPYGHLNKINKAIAALLNGYSEGDNWDLQPLFGENINELFLTKKIESEPSRQQEQPQEKLTFENYLLSLGYNHSYSEGSSLNLGNEVANDNSFRYFYSKVKNLKPYDIIYKLYNRNNNNDKPLLKRLVNDYVSAKKNNLVSLGNNEYVIYDDGKQGILVYNENNNTLLLKNKLNYKYYKDKLVNDYNAANSNNGLGGFASYFTEYMSSSQQQTPTNKKGGVLKAQGGTALDQQEELLPPGGVDDPWEVVTYNYNDLGSRIRIKRNRNDYTYVDRLNIKNTDTNAPGNNAYDPEGNIDYGDVDWYGNWRDKLFSDKELAKKWVEAYLNLNTVNKDSYERKWYTNGLFDFDKFKNTNINSDTKLGIGHDFYKGLVYEIDGKYYNTIPDGYEKNGDPTDLNPAISVLKLKKTTVTPNSSDQEGSGGNDGNNGNNGNGREESDVIPVDNTSTDDNDRGQRFIRRIIPELIGTGRLFNSIRTNNLISKVLKEGVNPLLKDTYELQHPIIGDLATKQYLEGLAANTRREASPFTSDAHLWLASQMQALSQSQGLELKGLLADNQEIKRTLAEALKRIEDNIRRRSAVANENRAAINQVNLLLSQIEANRLNKNYQGFDNWLRDIESRGRSEYETNLAQQRNFQLNVGATLINNEYERVNQRLLAPYYEKLKENPSLTITNWPGYTNYLDQIKKLLLWRTSKLQALLASVYGFKYDDPYKNIAPDQVVKVSKGAKLIKRNKNIVNKVINNAYNT